LKTTGGKERMRAYCGEIGADLSDDKIAALHKDKTARYANLIAVGGLTLRPGIAGLVEGGRAQGLALAVATTTSRANVDALCQACWAQPATSVFDVIAAGDEVGVCQISCPPNSCGVSDFRGAGFAFWVQPDGSCGLPVAGLS
jgi:beta-phosphoglucomutase-like phosphatase (HAD superfamily)